MGKSKIKSTSKDAASAAAPASGLSSFLLGQADSKDAALDDIFAHSKGPSLAFEPKKAEPATAGSSTAARPSRTKKAADEVDNDAELSELESGAELSDLEDDEEEGEDAVEEAYAAKLAAAALKKRQANAAAQQGKKRKAEAEPEVDDEEVSDEDEGDESPVEVDDEEDEDDEPLDINDLITGALGGLPSGDKKGKKADKGGKKSAKALQREQETPEARDARTIFLGNVPADCSTSRSMKKALVRHVLQNPALSSALPAGCPPLKLDAIRFRSLAFASKVFGRKIHAGGTGDDGEEAGGRGRKRAREWRENEDSDMRGVRGGFKNRETAPAPSTGSNSQPLTDGQKRRVALIRGELNEGKKACNAYLVIAALPEGIDPVAVIKALVAATANTVFEGFTLHADAVRPRSAAALLAAAQMAAKPNMEILDVPRNQDAQHVSALEARRTLFIGGLDFAENEEAVRAATEAVLVRERGEAEGGRYVENVRIVRDPSTGLGKGFCYVLLQDESCVDELLALPPGKNLKISKRKVRLERCKTTAAAARAKASARTVAALPGRAGAAAAAGNGKKGADGRPKAVRLAAPRDPTLAKHGRTGPAGPRAEHQEKLAEALAKLPTDERKKIKSMDADRIARRASKKEQKRLSERYERKQANAAKKSGGGVAAEVLGKESRAMERKRKEKKRITKESKSGLKKKGPRT
ncbi:Nucleolar protein 12 [Rhodotorula kratochvilovae]